MKQAVAQKQDAGEEALSSKELKEFTQCYDDILSAGEIEIPDPPERNEKTRGRVKRHKSHNLHNRLVKHKDEVLRFMTDFAVPFDNNLAERDVRMAKLKQKVSGGFRSEGGGNSFSRLRSYLSTARKQGINQFQALIQLFNSEPFVPTID